MVTIKKDIWKGVDEGKVMELGSDETIKLLNARERRTLKRLKMNQQLKKFMEKVRKIKQTNQKKVIKTKIREAVILPEWLGLAFGVYNGKEYKRVDITLHKIGKRLGDFSHTTSRVLHSGPGVGATRGSKFVPLK